MLGTLAMDAIATRRANPGLMGSQCTKWRRVHPAGILAASSRAFGVCSCCLETSMDKANVHVSEK